jgi:hypothetical protein
MQVNTIHHALNRYFEGGFHGGITMLVLSIDNDGYHLYGDDIDDDCEPVSIDCDSLEGMVKRIHELQ